MGAITLYPPARGGEDPAWSEAEHDVAILHGDGIGVGVHCRVGERATVGYVEFPAVPGATGYSSVQPVGECPVGCGEGGSPDPSLTQRPALVRAVIAERVKAAFHVEDADAPTLDLYDAPLSGRHVGNRA